MEAKPLDAIPEETVTPAVAPAATPERVTSNVPKQTKPATAKNSGRVASGKRLAERNRLACEAKKKPKHKSRLQAQQLMQQITPQTQQNNQATTLVTIFLELVV